MKYIYIFILVGFVLFISCDDLQDVNAKKAPSGTLNIDLTRRTFSGISYNSMYVIEKNVKNYQYGNAISGIKKLYPLTKTVTTLVFNNDNTFTVIIDEQFTSYFDALYTYTYKQSSDRIHLNSYISYDDRYNSISATMNRSFGCTMDDGTTCGDSETVAYNGYTDQSYTKTTFTGIWSKYEMDSDGFEDVTTFYKGKLTKVESQKQIIADTTYTENLSPETVEFPENYLMNEEMDVTFLGTDSSNNNVYSFSIRYALDNAVLVLQ